MIQHVANANKCNTACLWIGLNMCSSGKRARFVKLCESQQKKRIDGKQRQVTGIGRSATCMRVNYEEWVGCLGDQSLKKLPTVGGAKAVTTMMMMVDCVARLDPRRG